MGGKRYAAPCGLLADIQLRQRLLQMAELGQIVDGDVRLVWMKLRVILVIVLCGIERLQRHYLRHNGLRKSLGAVELINIGLRNALLLVIGIEDYRAVLSAVVRPLPVQFRGIMRDGKK